MVGQRRRSRAVACRAGNDAGVGGKGMSQEQRSWVKDSGVEKARFQRRSDRKDAEAVGRCRVVWREGGGVGSGYVGS